MRVSSQNIAKIRKCFLENSDYTLEMIAAKLSIDKSTVQFALSHENLNVVASKHEANVYFLFTDFLEKRIETDLKKKVKNTPDFNDYEKTFLRGYGFRF